MTITVKNINIFYKDTGTGNPILFLHGVPDSSDIWDEIIENLKTQHRCIAPDWPGFARSGSGKNLDCSLDGHADFVRDLADELGLKEPFDIVSHDFGSVSAMAFVSKYPNRVQRLVISNAPFSGDYRWHTWARIWRTPILGELSNILMNRWMFELSLKRGSKKLSKTHIHSTYDRIHKEMKKMVLKMYRGIDEKEWFKWNLLLVEATAKTPTLILWGQNDPYLPNWLPETYGNCEIIRYSDSGHWVPAEEKAEVIKELRKFLCT